MGKKQFEGKFWYKEFFQENDGHLILSCPKCNCPLVDFVDIVPQTDSRLSIVLRFKTYCEHRSFMIAFCQNDGDMLMYAATIEKRIDYYEYIQSEEWKEKALQAKERAGWRCQVCNRSADESLTLDAHHRTYERLGNELHEDITVLCRDCHELYETNRKAKKNGQK